MGSAALKYFGKPVSELTLAECASLIGITNNPSKYGPYSFAKSKTSDGEVWDARQWNKYRQEVVLDQMLEQGMITQEEYDEAVAQELVFVRAEGEEADEPRSTPGTRRPSSPMCPQALSGEAGLVGVHGQPGPPAGRPADLHLL